MHKDLKMGLYLGIALTMASVLYLATHPSLGLNRFRRRPGNAAGKSQKQQIHQANQPAPAPIRQIEPKFPPEEPDVFDWTRFEAESNRKTERFHIVGKNETLSEVARRYYGSSGQWRKIYNANRSVIKNPDTLRPGTKLIIPE
ncbi:MAG: LysM peptidoglycan-binding domain-containing protein [Planctomycetota bacterium]|jgi:nucleoid-associated protein YgaU